MFRNELEQQNRARCCDCTLWSGHPGNRKGDLICAVNPTIQPSGAELEKVDNRTAYARHDCPDFESAIVKAQSIMAQTRLTK